MVLHLEEVRKFYISCHRFASVCRLDFFVGSEFKEVSSFFFENIFNSTLRFENPNTTTF